MQSKHVPSLQRIILDKIANEFTPVQKIHVARFLPPELLQDFYVNLSSSSSSSNQYFPPDVWTELRRSKKSITAPRKLKIDTMECTRSSFRYFADICSLGLFQLNRKRLTDILQHLQRDKDFTLVRNPHIISLKLSAGRCRDANYMYPECFHQISKIFPDLIRLHLDVRDFPFFPQVCRSLHCSTDLAKNLRYLTVMASNPTLNFDTNEGKEADWNPDRFPHLCRIKLCSVDNAFLSYVLSGSTRSLEVFSNFEEDRTNSFAYNFDWSRFQRLSDFSWVCNFGHHGNQIVRVLKKLNARCCDTSCASSCSTPPSFTRFNFSLMDWPVWWCFDVEYANMKSVVQRFIKTNPDLDGHSISQLHTTLERIHVF
jgi:hypothetical protein